MTFDEAVKATPLIAQFFYMGVGALLGLVPAIILWVKVLEARSKARLANRILKIKEEYVQQLQTSSREERDRFNKFALGLLEDPKPTNINLN
jgi:hypothetical protein